LNCIWKFNFEFAYFCTKFSLLQTKHLDYFSWQTVSPNSDFLKLHHNYLLSKIVIFGLWRQLYNKSENIKWKIQDFLATLIFFFYFWKNPKKIISTFLVYSNYYKQVKNISFLNYFGNITKYFFRFVWEPYFYKTHKGMVRLQPKIFKWD
jgi:hypothetical protein